MGLFSKFKKRRDVIDLGMLQRKGIIDLKQEKEQVAFKKDKEGYIHFNSSNSNISESATGENGLGFLGNLANASTNLTESQASNLDIDDKTRIAEKFREIENKIKYASKKIYDISQRIELIERKIERSERKNTIV